MIDFEVTGIEELTRKLDGKELLRKPLRRLFYGIGNSLKKSVKEKTPVQSGKLQASIKSSVSRDVIPLWCKVSTRVFYGKYLERGTKKMGAVAMFEKALEEHRDRINEYIKKAEQDIQTVFNSPGPSGP